MNSYVAGEEFIKRNFVMRNSISHKHIVKFGDYVPERSDMTTKNYKSSILLPGTNYFITTGDPHTL
jgi:hypothetical protein